MANEKILNTRIQLKYDSFANWENSTVILKAGEIAIAYLGETVSEKIKGENRPVLFKVGDGVKTFANLPWASALAADVYDWAKKEHLDLIDLPDIPVVDSETGKFVTDVEWDATNNQLIIHRANVVAADIADAPWLTSESKDYGKVTADAGELEADEIHDVFAIKGNAKAIATKAENDAVIIDLKLDNSGNVALSQSATGLKAEVDLSEYAKTADLPTNHKVIQTPVDDPTADGSTLEFIDTISQNENGEITVTKKSVDLSEYRKIVDDVDTNTAHTHVDGAGVKVTGKGGIEGEVKIDLDVKFNDKLVTKDNKEYLQLLDATDNSVITEFDVTEFVKDGMLESVTVDKEKNEITFTWNTDGATTATTVTLSEIADIYTGGTNDDITVAVSNQNVITATLNKNFALADDLAKYQPIGNYKTQQTAVINKITDKAHVLTSLTQNANGEIDYVVKTLTPADIGAQPAGDYQAAGDYKTIQEEKTFTGSIIKTVTGVTQDTNGEIDVVFAEIDFPAPVDISGKKDKQEAVVVGPEDHKWVNSISQDENGVITASLKRPSGYDLEEVSTAKNKDDAGVETEVPCLIFYCGDASTLI